MRPRLNTITTPLSLLIVSAAASTFIPQLPSCWHTCIENRGPQCDSTNLNCLCHFAATTTLHPALATCVRKTCDSKFYSDSLAPSKAVQMACGGTSHGISDKAVGKADAAAESVYSATLDKEKGRGGSATRMSLTKSWDAKSTGKTTAKSTANCLEVMVLGGASTARHGIVSTVTTSTPVDSLVASVGPTSGVSMVSGPVTTSPVDFASSASTSTSTSVAYTLSDSGGTPLDVGEQGAGVKKRAGSLLGLALAFVVGMRL